MTDSSDLPTGCEWLRITVAIPTPTDDAERRKIERAAADGAVRGISEAMQ